MIYPLHTGNPSNGGNKSAIAKFCLTSLCFIICNDHSASEEIKIVPEEVLEEQKQETLSNGEMIAILKQLLQKLSTPEKGYANDEMPALSGKIDNLQLTCKRMEDRFNLLHTTQLAAGNLVLRKMKVFSYRFQLKQGFQAGFISLSLICITGYFVRTQQVSSYKNLIQQLQVNDHKYWFIKTSDNKIIKKNLRSADSL